MKKKERNKDDTKAGKKWDKAWIKDDANFISLFYWQGEKFQTAKQRREQESWANISCICFNSIKA